MEVLQITRGVAQLASALAWGARGRKFESFRPDRFENQKVGQIWHKKVCQICSSFVRVLGTVCAALRKKMPTDKHLSASKIQTFLPAVVRQSKSMGIFLEYYVLNPETDAMERKRMRLQKIVKKYKKTHEQMMAARNICEEVNRKLSGGWTPLHETEDGRLYTKIQDLRERFLTHKKAEGLRPATLQSYSSMTGLFLSWCEDTGRARKMSGTFLKIDAVSYMDYILDKGFSNRSYNNTAKTLKVFFSWAKENCYCKENPFDYIKPLPKEKKRRTLIDRETRQRLSDFLSSYSPQFLIVCKLIYYSAMRPKEIANIQIRDIDIKNRCIHVHELHRCKKRRLCGAQLRLVYQRYRGLGFSGQRFPPQLWISCAYGIWN